MRTHHFNIPLAYTNSRHSWNSLHDINGSRIVSPTDLRLYCLHKTFWRHHSLCFGHAHSSVAWFPWSLPGLDQSPANFVAGRRVCWPIHGRCYFAGNRFGNAYPGVLFINMNQPAHSWWRHQMEPFSALLALYMGNSPVTDEFPSQRTSNTNFDVSWQGSVRISC